jgi:hypothetical protein
MSASDWRRTMRVLLAFVAALIAATASAAKAEDAHSANNIMRGCRAIVSDSTVDDPNDSFLAGVCAGTIDGLIYEADILRLSSAPAPHAEVFCIPKETTNEQQIRIVVKYIEERPEQMHKRFVLLALLALENAWPCKH